MELKTTADRREYLYAQAWVDEPASGMDVINLLSDLTAALARVEELEEELTASQRQAQRLAEKFCDISTEMGNVRNDRGFCEICDVCSGENECEGITCEDVILSWAKGDV